MGSEAIIIIALIIFIVYFIVLGAILGALALAFYLLINKVRLQGLRLILPLAVMGMALIALTATRYYLYIPYVGFIDPLFFIICIMGSILMAPVFERYWRMKKETVVFIGSAIALFAYQSISQTQIPVVNEERFTQLIAGIKLLAQSGPIYQDINMLWLVLLISTFFYLGVALIDTILKRTARVTE